MPAVSSDRSLSLICHPAAVCPAVVSIDVRVASTADGGLWLGYRLSGRIAGIVLPLPAPAGPADGLWEHTCFEAFVGIAGDPAYREFNFSPSGQWAAYAFADYRRRAGWAPPAAPRLALRRFPDRVELDAWIGPELLPAAVPPVGRLALGLSAVIEAADGDRSYWALAHPADRPDFHRRDGFVVDLTAIDPCS